MGPVIQTVAKLTLVVSSALTLVACGGATDTSLIDSSVSGAASTHSTTYTLGGTLSGLNNGATLVLQGSAGDLLTLTTNSAFTFATPYAPGASYSVTIHTSPVGQSCSVDHGTGTMPASNVTSVAVSCTTLTATTTDCKNCFKKRFIYFSGNITRSALDADKDFKQLADLIPRAKAAGYNGIAFAAGGTGSFDYMLVKPSTYYYSNFAAIVKKAADAGIELIPTGATPAGIGQLDPSLLEAFPVTGTPFVVSAGRATNVSSNILTNSGFEPDAKGWNMDTASVSFDSAVSHGTGGAIKFDEAAQSKAAIKMSRLMRKIAGLTPHRAYRLSFWVKTSNYDSPLKVLIYDKDVSQPLFFNGNNLLGWSTVDGSWSSKPNAVASTQGWTQYNLDFNSVTQDTINLFIGAWTVGTSAGAAWIDDITLTEVGLAHTQQRATLPITVTSADGATTFSAGTDYTVDVEALKIPTGSKIKDKSTLKVSWYQSSKYMESQYNTPASTCSPRYFELATDVLQRTDKLMNHPKGYFMYFDEWRVMNWDPSCGAITAGTYLKNTTQKVQNILLSINPNYDLYIWNDMFDPHHNAIDRYWTVNGSLSKAWDGLHPRTTVMNWNPFKKQQVDSLKFFSDLGLKQMIALYYDDPTLARTKDWMDSLVTAQAAGVTDVEGFMFTTWSGNYDDLEKVANFIKTNYPQYWK